MAGEATTAVQPGDGAPSTTPAGDAGTQKPGADPNNLTPEQLAAVNARFERDKAALLDAARKRWETEQAEAKKQAEMSELEKLSKERNDLEQKSRWAEEALAYERNRVKLRDAALAKGLRSTVYVEHVLSEWDEAEEFDADALAQKALDLFNAEHGLNGSTKPKPPPSTGGTPTRSTGDLDFSRMTAQEVADHAKSLGPLKGGLFLNTTVKNFRDGGGRFADER